MREILGNITQREYSRRDSNPRSPVYKSGALANYATGIKMVPSIGIEPMTFALQVRCSTD